MTSSDEQHSQDDEVFTQIQPQITTVTNTNAKFPYLKKGEYDIWAMKMQNYITNSDLPCWNIVLNGNSRKKTTKDSNGNIKICPPVSAEEHLAVQRETKARTTLLTALPDDHMGDFYHLDDAKEIWLAIKARFGGNEESKKMQKSFLKQEFEEFKITEAEGLHTGYDKFQKILSQMNTLKVRPENEDVNLKFLRALPPSWSQVTLVLKTKGGLEYLSFDDLYNKLKSLEFDVKGYAPKPSSLANAAFVSTASTNNNNDTSSNHSPSYSTSSSYSGNREASSSHGSVVDDVIHSFLAESEPKQQLAYEDLKQIEKLDLEELDLKWQMAMLSIRVQKFEKKAGRKIKFNGQEAARFDKKLVQCYKCSQKGHFARECRAKASQDSQRYSAYKTQNAGKKTDDSQALISVDTFINWQDHEDAHADEGALKIYGMIAGMESDPDSERKATSEYALMGFTTDKEVQTCSFECEYKYNELKKLYNEQREEISNSSVELNAYKSGVKTLEAQIRCHQKNQLAYEEKIRILKFDLEDKSNLLAYHEKLVANAAQEKQALQAKLDNEIANTANWLQSSKNLVKLIDSSISVKDKVGLGYGSYENELYIDNKPSIFDYRPEDWLGKPLYSWFTKEGDMHGVPLPMTGNYMPTPIHVEIDESQFSYGQKQTNISETSSENVKTCESNGNKSNESKNNNFDSCESNFSVSTLESTSETVVEPEPKCNNEGGLSNLPDPEIYDGLTHIGYQTEGHLTFWKNRKNEVLFNEEVAVFKREIACKDYEINVLKSEFEKVKQEKNGIDFRIKKLDKASKDLDQLLGSQISDKSKKGLGYSVVPPPHPLIYNRPKKLDMPYSGLDEFKEREFKSYGLENKEQVSQDKSSFVKSSLNVDKETVFPVNKKVEFAKAKNPKKPVKKSVRLITITIKEEA
ncbi:ribonuclease H-like domain-containing protein [Tanacetum coccineum]